MQYTKDIFSEAKIENFIGKVVIFLILLRKTLIVRTSWNRLDEATCNLCFVIKIRKKYVYPCHSQFFFIKGEFKWVCFPDDHSNFPTQTNQIDHMTAKSRNDELNSK